MTSSISLLSEAELIWRSPAAFDPLFSSMSSSRLGKIIVLVNSSLTRPLLEILPSRTSGGRLPFSSFSAPLIANSIYLSTFAAKFSKPDFNFSLRGLLEKSESSSCSLSDRDVSSSTCISSSIQGRSSGGWTCSSTSTLLSSSSWGP